MKVAEPKNLRPYNQHQSLLFPPNLQDLLQDNDLCQVVDDVVNSLDLSCLYQKVSFQGNMAYHPKMMLKVLFYSYAIGIFSSRKIANALGENLALIFLAAWQRPDFRTLNSFRKNNMEAIRDLFGQIITLCQQLNMVKLGHISIDGSKFKADAADRRSYDKKRIDKEIDSILEQAEQIDREEDDLYGPDRSGDELPEPIRDRKERLKRLEQIKKELNLAGKKKINATDPDARFMKTKNGVKTCYNAQACVDQDSQVIIAAHVTNQPDDHQQLIPMIEQAKDNTGADAQVLTADSGYSTASNLEALESCPGEAYIPDGTYQSRKRGKPIGPFDKDKFVYDPADDVFICPEGKRLGFWYTKNDKRGGIYQVYRHRHCQSCAHFGQCTKSKRGRSVWRRLVDEKVRVMREKLDTPIGKELYAKRKHIIEPVFGQIKGAMGFTGFHLRSLSKVNLEFLIVSTAHNLRKIARYGYQKGIGLVPRVQPEGGL